MGFDDLSKIVSIDKIPGPPIDGVYEFETCYGPMRCWWNESHIVHVIRQGDVWEGSTIRGTLAPFIQQASVIVDVGAHCGCFTVACGAINKHATIYSFEPQRRQFELLCQNVALNNLGSRVQLFWCALGHQRGSAEMATSVADGPNANESIEYGSNRPFNFGGLALGRGGEPVQMIPLDELALPGCDLLKIDVEGFEPWVLMGAQDTIAKYRPVIVFERNEKQITKDAIDYFSIPQSVDSVGLINAWGYVTRQVGDDNILAIPEERQD